VSKKGLEINNTGEIGIKRSLVEKSQKIIIREGERGLFGS